MRLGSQPAFTGNVLDATVQRALFRRWTDHATHPHERLTGLLTLLHAASNAQIRGLTTGDADAARRTLNLAGRPFPVPLDPVSWAALQDCLRHRADLRTLNPHVIVTRATRTGDSPAHQTYLTRVLRPSGTTPSLCRQMTTTTLQPQPMFDSSRSPVFECVVIEPHDSIAGVSLSAAHCGYCAAALRG